MQPEAPPSPVGFLPAVTSTPTAAAAADAAATAAAAAAAAGGGAIAAEVAIAATRVGGMTRGGETSAVAGAPG